MSGLGAFLGGIMAGVRDTGRGRAPESGRPDITPGWVHMMARYNAWQNSEIGTCYLGACRTDKDAWFAPRGAFWGSIFATLNHILWGDRVWMNRFEGKPAPDTPLSGSGTLFDAKGPGEFWEARQAVDRRILDWAADLSPRDLQGTQRWFSEAEGRDVSVPLATCVVHLFNHQTHHRGQAHAMAAQAGLATWTTDLVFMPKEDT